MNKASKIRTILFLFCSLVSLNAFSQHSINVAGNTATINGYVFDYSIGEMALITTEQNTNLIVTQGLLQPHGSGKSDGTSTLPGNETTQTLSEQIKVYPNPTRNILNVESLDIMDSEISYQLFDALGKVVLSHSFLQKKGLNKFSLDVRNFAAGSYYLMIRKPNIHGEIENYSYKIQKSN